MFRFNFNSKINENNFIDFINNSLELKPNWIGPELKLFIQTLKA